ncbi:MAG: DUF4294 domain-containing protein [Bacteroidota bacterium]|nr:DUF4294 domain-containing protein [Bacteroidota bacterium]
MKIKIIIIILYFFAGNIFAQHTTVVVENDTILVSELPTFTYTAKMTEEQRRAYYRLISRVKFVLPYAKMAAFHLQQVEQKLQAIPSKKDRKKFVKKYSKELKESFQKQLKNLTIDEGKLMVKLVSRETGATVYGIMSEYYGSAEKFFYNSFSSLYGYDLDETYDPVENFQIEKIIHDYKLE